MNRSVCSEIKVVNDDFIHENCLSVATKEPVKVNVHSSNIERHIDTYATKVGCGELSLELL